MEIIHVVLGKANPDRMNGVNKVVYQLATQQKNAGQNVSVWGITRDCTHNYPARVFETRLFKAYKNKFRLDPEFINALGDLKGKPVFHLHGGFNPIFFSVSKALHKSGIPFVFTPHGAYNKIAMEKSWLTKKLYMRLFEKHVIKTSASIHCLGNSEVAGTKTIYPKAKYELIPYGFESETGIMSIPDYHKFIIGFCGRIDIYTKGLDALIAAFGTIRKQIPQAELWIIGDSREKETLKRMIDRIGSTNITLWGSKYGAEKDDLIRQMHVFAHPSRNEGLPSSVLEAASMGVPCVVTTATNVGNTISKHGCGAVIDHTDANELSEAVIGIYQKIRTQGWKNISDAARTMVREEYNWNSILNRFDKLYREVCH
jgi:glycosyltransferase involved in cell wall biosynthesis